MKILSIMVALITPSLIFKVITACVGLYSTYLWLKASKVKIVPSLQNGMMEVEDSQRDLECAIMKAYQDSAESQQKSLTLDCIGSNMRCYF